jgi:hypothetical protein
MTLWFLEKIRLNDLVVSGKIRLNNLVVSGKNQAK